MSKLKTLKEVRNELVVEYLCIFNNNKTKTAEALGVSIRSLAVWIKEIESSNEDLEKAMSALNKKHLDGVIDKDGNMPYMPSNEERLYYLDNPDRKFERGKVH